MFTLFFIFQFRFKKKRKNQNIKNLLKNELDKNNNRVDPTLSWRL